MSMLTFEEARILRCALSVAGYTQEFDDLGECETWVVSENVPESRVVFFSIKDAGVEVSYSDAQVYKRVTFEEAMEAIT